ncbi:MAG: hypothetical protein CMO72_04595, partial [Verrucomicrobiales bacterium]|nr:hypothetical protein [Verrucomicrobiales bacterium]
PHCFAVKTTGTATAGTGSALSTATFTRAATACTGSAFTWATLARSTTAGTWACWSVTLLPLEKFLHLFSARTLVLIEFAILVFVKFLKK